MLHPRAEPFEVRVQAHWRERPAIEPGAEGGEPSEGGQRGTATAAASSSSSSLAPAHPPALGVTFREPFHTPSTAATHATPETPRSLPPLPPSGRADADAASYGVLGLSSIFTNKFLQARRKKPHRVQFFSGSCGVFEQWELMGGAKTRHGRQSVWGILARRPAGEETDVGGDDAGGGGAWLSRGMSSSFGKDQSARLGGRDFCVVRSRQAPDCVILLVRLRNASGEALSSNSPEPM